MARILFTCRPLAGHFHPLLPLADAARAAGHEVGFASGDPVVGQAKELGYVCFAVGAPESFRLEWAPRFPGFTSLVGDAMRRFFFTEIFAGLELGPRAVDLEQAMSEWQPALVVHEVAELAAPMVSTMLGVPYVDVGFGPLIPRSLLEAAGAAAGPQWRACGLEPHPLAGLFEHAYIDPCPPSLQNPEVADLARVLQVRPVEVDGATAQSPEWFRNAPPRPLVYATLGTIWNNDLAVFHTIIEALRDHVNLIVTVGRQNDPGALGPQPANVVVSRYIPQDQVLGWCAAAVVHGGAGTTLGALAAGVPLLVLPQGADQWSNAAKVASAAAGRTLLRDEVTVVSVREAILALVNEPSYRINAERIQAEIRAMPTAADAIRSLADLL